MRILAIEVIRLELVLNESMQTSYDTISARPALIVRVLSDIGEGYGECSALQSPTYTEEYLNGAELVLAQQLIPRLLAAGDLADANAAMASMVAVRANPMAKAALEMAVLDLELREKGQSLAGFLGSTRAEIEAGVNLGIDEPKEVLARVEAALSAGYRRIKCKIAPGRDVAIVAAIREEHPDLVCCVDANGSYSLGDREHRRSLDELDTFGLTAIEQPLANDAWQEHAQLSEKLSTPIVLDESIASLADLETTISYHAADGISIKPARVGGLLIAKGLVDRASANDLSLSIGGMYETGLGRAAAIGLGAHEAFDLPGDLGGSERYFSPDITAPHVVRDGLLDVPDTPGIGRVPNAWALAAFGAKRTVFRRF